VDQRNEEHDERGVEPDEASTSWEIQDEEEEEQVEAAGHREAQDNAASRSATSIK